MPISRRDPAQDEGGFTLAEMLLVVAVMALAAGLVVGRGLPGQHRVDRAALQSFVQGARADAMRTDRIVALSVGKDGHSFVAGTKVLALAPDHQATIVGSAGAGGSGAGGSGAGSEISGSAGGAAITFGPDGSSGGGLLRVLSPGAEDRLVIAPNSGVLLP